MKLSHKLFSVHLLVSFVLLLLVGATFEFYASRHFQEMGDRLETEILTVLSYELALEYQRNKNWDEFKNNPGRFDEFIQTILKNKGYFPKFHAPPGSKVPPAPPFPPANLTLPSPHPPIGTSPFMMPGKPESQDPNPWMQSLNLAPSASMTRPWDGWSFIRANACPALERIIFSEISL